MLFLDSCTDGEINPCCQNCKPFSPLCSHMHGVPLGSLLRRKTLPLDWRTSQCSQSLVLSAHTSHARRRPNPSVLTLISSHTSISLHRTRPKIYILKHTSPKKGKAFFFFKGEGRRLLVPLVETTQNSSSRCCPVEQGQRGRQAPTSRFSWGCSSAPAYGEPRRRKVRSYSQAAGPSAAMQILEPRHFFQHIRGKGTKDRTAEAHIYKKQSPKQHSS